MRWVGCRIGLAVLAAIGVVACDRLSGVPSEVAPTPSAAEAAPGLDPDIRPYAGRTYAEVLNAPEMGRYSLASLHLNEAERARFDAGMAVQEPAVVASGGGAEALVFSGCAISGCAHGRSVLAIDARTGAVFVGVAGQGGAEQILPNDRLEALLRVTSPTMRWDDPMRAPQAASQPDNTP
ncbi:hypothetical protein [Vitreimonas sp.]|uniref:hypothetical protein n=1 Tax=Vitreimonas sp. TaxID=3069702 RepID=UPI002EDA54B3